MTNRAHGHVPWQAKSANSMDSKQYILSESSSTPRPEISVSLVNYNSTDFLIQCLDSVKKQLNGLIVEILIVDNASVDFDPNRIYQIFPSAIITVNQKNKGFAYAQNQNFILSNADYFLLLNPDLTLTPGAIQGILDTFYRFSDVAIVGPNLIGTDGRSLVNVKRFPSMKSAFSELLLFNAIGTERDAARSIPDAAGLNHVECITGAAFAVRSHIYRSLGGLDPGFFMYFEEVDFCRRVSRLPQQKIALLTHLKVLHYHGRSSIQTDVRQTVYYESYYRYFKKHYGFLISFFIRILILYNTVARLAGIQIKYFPLAIGWREYRRKTASTFRLLFWALGLRESSRGSFR
jgi:N-acetylglucosaminyl-diphospho-decaprenol L-rhamnosyltransferase